MAAVYFAIRRLRQLGHREHRRRKVHEDAFELPDDQFRRLFRLEKDTAVWLCDELADELGGLRASAVSVRRQVLCALRFFATGGFQAGIGNEVYIGLSQPQVSRCVHRVAEAIVKVGTERGWVGFPQGPQEKAAVKEGCLRLGSIPGVVGCVDGTLVAIAAPRGNAGHRAAFWSRKGYYAVNAMIVCDANMRILAIDTRCPGSCHDAFVWRYGWLHQDIEDGLLDRGEFLLGDSGYPLEPWLLTPVAGHPSATSAEGMYNAAHASMRSVVERCIGVLKSRFRCLQRYRTLHYQPERAAFIIGACVALHNLCLGAPLPADEDATGYDSNGRPLPDGYLPGPGARLTYVQGQAVRRDIIELFRRPQHHRRQLRRLQQRAIPM
uniref:Putative pif ele1 orf1-h 1e-40-j 4 n=1 Tax=Amblyomma triste TaxID=251400 RepID=A0A023G5D7_AMBTT